MKLAGVIKVQIKPDNTIPVRLMDIPNSVVLPDAVQSDQEQNDDSQPDYIRNRTHYKETNSEGQVVYHTLDNKYLNLDNEVRQDSNNPVTAKAVYKAVNEAEPEALTNFEIEELLKNFV